MQAGGFTSGCDSSRMSGLEELTPRAIPAAAELFGSRFPSSHKTLLLIAILPLLAFALLAFRMMGRPMRTHQSHIRFSTSRWVWHCGISRGGLFDCPMSPCNEGCLIDCLTSQTSPCSRALPPGVHAAHDHCRVWGLAIGSENTMAGTTGGFMHAWAHGC